MTWLDNDLTAFAGGVPATGQLDAYSQSDNSQHVNYIDVSGNVHELYRSPNPAAQWLDNNLTAFAGGTPASGSALHAYSQSDSSQHVNFIDVSGNVHELYRSPNPAAQWVDNNLTAFARGTPAVINGPLSGYSQDDHSQHVNFIDINGHVHELYRSPNPAAQWVDNDLTAFAGGTPAFTEGGFSISPLDAYAQNDNSQHLNFIDAVGHAHELYRSPNPADQWVDNDLTALAAATPARVGGAGLDAYTEGDNSQHVNFIASDGHVHELYRSPDPAAQWVDNDLTALAGAPPAFVMTSDGYIQADGGQHVNFVDSARHVHDLFRSPDPAVQWVDSDLTALAGGPQALESLDGYSQADGSLHINYIDVSGNVHELLGRP